MLVLSRQVDESIVINDNIVITVLAVEGDRVKIGIRAPREIIILRQELWQAMQEQEQIAADLASKPESESIQGLRKFLADEADRNQADTKPVKKERGGRGNAETPRRGEGRRGEGE